VELWGWKKYCEWGQFSLAYVTVYSLHRQDTASTTGQRMGIESYKIV